MQERKYPGRFTLQFNMEDPQQMRAAEVLEQQGRRKAQFLTAAILQYMRHPEGLNQSPNTLGYDMNVLRELVQKVLREDLQLSIPGQENQKSAVKELDTPSDERDELTISDGILAAMSNTLAAFQGK